MLRARVDEWDVGRPRQREGCSGGNASSARRLTPRTAPPLAPDPPAPHPCTTHRGASQSCSPTRPPRHSRSGAPQQHDRPERSQERSESTPKMCRAKATRPHMWARHRPSSPGWRRTSRPLQRPGTPLNKEARPRGRARPPPIIYLSGEGGGVCVCVCGRGELRDRRGAKRNRSSELRDQQTRLRKTGVTGKFRLETGASQLVIDKPPALDLTPQSQGVIMRT